MIGQTLGHYRITGKLGEGGMGEVYRATDSKLGREVAIKVLPAAFASDPDRMARFQREAQVLASLNHPNIAQIYGIEERAIVMELVAGETVCGPLPLDTALKYAGQIADALEAAHEKGITHRDLKPANIMITPDGVVKVLDFGLAQMAQPNAASGNPMSSPTLTMRATEAGMIMGTAAYMAPEQARGQAVDKRADIWAFGVVLWEILTGKQMFAGETISDVLAAVLTKPPDLEAAPSQVRRLLTRCLEKDPRKRLRDIGDWRGFLEERSHESKTASKLPWIAAAVFAVGAVALALIHFRESPPAQRPIRFSISPPEKVSFEDIVPSPDGRRLVFSGVESGNSRLWLRPLDSLTAQPLAGTEGGYSPFWSPDSRFIGFFTFDGKLKKIDVSGGPPQTLCDAQLARGGTWNRGGVILFGQVGRPLFRVPAEGGEARPAFDVAHPAEQAGRHRYPFFLPDERHFLYYDHGPQPETSGIYVGALDSRERTRVLGDQSNAAYAEAPSGAGYLLFWRAGSLMAQLFDANNLRLSGGPFPVAERVGYYPPFQRASFSVARSGVLVFNSLSMDQDQLVWFDRKGKRLAKVGEPAVYRHPRLSPGERFVVVNRSGAPSNTALNLWLIDLARDVSTRFTFASNQEVFPVWSPDESSIVFASNRDGVFTLYRKSVSGGGSDELLLKSGAPKFPRDFSPDGHFLLYDESNPKTKYDLMLLPDPGGTPGGKNPIPFLQTEFNEQNGAFSPDGKWIAYEGDESGKYEIYVQPFPSTGAKWIVSTSGGRWPKWRGDGKELFFLRGTTLMAVEVKGGASFEVGLPQPLFETPLNIDVNKRYSVTRDGQRFLMPAPGSDSAATPATVVIDWMAGIRR